MGWVGIVIFLVVQVALLFAFYRVVIRQLPGQINDLLFRQHVQNDFTGIASDTAKLVQEKLLMLEAERLDAIVAFEAVKGKRLRTTESAQRQALKQAVSRLSKQIDGLRGQLDAMYAPEVMSHLRKFEELRLVAALNRFLDKKTKGQR